MNRHGTDPKVKKTLVRNCEQKVRASTRTQVLRDVNPSSSSMAPEKATLNEDELSQPTLCSTEALANYLSDIKKTTPPAPLSTESSNTDRVQSGQLCSKMTKKLNFHFNDRIYRNLIELNATIDDLKTRKDRRPISTSSVKKDFEPNIEDFCEDERESDSPPSISVVKPKFRPVKKMEDGQLHKLVASFEVL